MCVRERERKREREREREREKERERLSQTVCQNCEMHYLPAWARWLLNEILTGHWEHRFLIQLQWCVCEKKTSIQTVWRWWERESGEDEWVKSRQKIERERKKREFLWRIVCVWEKNKHPDGLKMVREGKWRGWMSEIETENWEREKKYRVLTNCSLALLLVTHAMHRHTHPHATSEPWHLGQFAMSPMCQSRLTLLAGKTISTPKKKDPCYIRCFCLRSIKPALILSP